MTRPRLTSLALALLVLGASACEKHEFHPPDPEERVEAAAAEYDASAFDSISWTAESDRMTAGNIVYAQYCRRCHGPLGLADTDYARNRELEVPSLVEPDWPLADDQEGVRQTIYAGHASGMPTFSLTGLTPRDIDAVTAYILYQLRPEALSEEN